MPDAPADLVAIPASLLLDVREWATATSDVARRVEAVVEAQRETTQAIRDLRQAVQGPIEAHARYLQRLQAGQDQAVTDAVTAETRRKAEADSMWADFWSRLRRYVWPLIVAAGAASGWFVRGIETPSATTETPADAVGSPPTEPGDADPS